MDDYFGIDMGNIWDCIWDSLDLHGILHGSYIKNDGFHWSCMGFVLVKIFAITTSSQNWMDPCCTGFNLSQQRLQASDLQEQYTAWWLGHPSEKYEFVNWDDEMPFISGKIKNGNQTTNQYRYIPIKSINGLVSKRILHENMSNFMGKYRGFPCSLKNQSMEKPMFQCRNPLKCNMLSPKNYPKLAFITDYITQ